MDVSNVKMRWVFIAILAVFPIIGLICSIAYRDISMLWISLIGAAFAAVILPVSFVLLFIMGQVFSRCVLLFFWCIVALLTLTSKALGFRNMSSFDKMFGKREQDPGQLYRVKMIESTLMTELPLQQKRLMLEQYSEQQTGRHYFELLDGTKYEGGIQEVGESTIEFVCAFSPFDDANANYEPIEIPIDIINVNSFR